MHSGLDWQLAHQRRFELLELANPGAGHLPTRDRRRMAEKELEVPALGSGKLAVKGAQVSGERSPSQQAEPLARASLDETADEQLVEKTDGPGDAMPNLARESSHIAIRAGSGEAEATRPDLRMDEREVAELLTGENSEIADQLRLIGVTTRHRHGVGRRLELAVSVVDEESIEIRSGNLDPTGRGWSRKRQSLERILGQVVGQAVGHQHGACPVHGTDYRRVPVSCMASRSPSTSAGCSAALTFG